jgi:outer membrane protein assembly factor BamB
MAKPRTYGKYLLTLVMVLVVISLTACTKTTTTTTTATATVTSTATTTATATATVTATPPAATVTVTATPQASPTPTPAANAIPPEITQYAKDWPLPNHDYSQTRATTDSTINSSNVGTLGAVWAFPVSGTGLFGSLSCTPIVMGSNIYLQDLGNNMYSIDLAKGTLNWSKIYNETNVGPNGVAVGWGKVFGTIDPYTFAALDMASGKQLWTSTVSNNPTAGTDMQPQVYNGQVFTSTVPGSSGGDFYTGGGIGTFYALDQTTGKPVWTWDSVDTKTIWGNKDVNSGGGAWYPPAIDTNTGIQYWGIGNPAPWPGTPAFPNGSSRPGPNLYTDCMVALSQTGVLQWYTQVTAHDNTDADFQVSPILANATIGGVKQDIVIGAGKSGKVVAFNRKTGAILWETLVGTHQNDNLVNFPAGTTRVYPGSLGGVETPMAYSNGIVFVPVVNHWQEYTPSAVGASQPFNTSTGDFVAIQADTGKILWDNALPSSDYSGATVVNDVVFTATFDGTLYAFKTTTGEKLWSYQIPAGANSWPSVAGNTLLWPCGLGSVPSLVAFKLGANTPVLDITPADGSSVQAGDITVSALALNFSLVDKLGTASVAGQGHLHYFMDVDAPTTPGAPAVTAAGTYVPTAKTTNTWKNVAPGKHTFSVELVNNDHTPLNPPVVAKSTVTVIPPQPSITINLPLNRSTLPAGDVTISVKVSNFNLVDKLGQANVAGEGHIHYFLDVVAPTAPGVPAVTAAGTYAATSATSYTWKNLTPGTHILSVELINNDHTPLATPVVAKIVIVISASGTVGGP